MNSKKVLVLDSDLLEYYYWGLNYSANQIASIYGCAKSWILKNMRLCNIPRRNQKIARIIRGINRNQFGDKLDIEPELLLALYWGNQFNTPGIAKMFKCNKLTIARKLKSSGIPIRDWNKIRRINIESELLWALYWGLEYNAPKIGRVFNYSKSSILKLLKENNIPRRKAVGKYHGHWNENKDISLRKRIYWMLPDETRMKVRERDNLICSCCGKQCKINDSDIDHIIPVSYFARKFNSYDECIKAGVNSLSNLQVLCKKCNSQKSAKLFMPIKPS